MPPELINNLPSPGLIDNTDKSAIDARAEDINDYNSDNDIDQRVAVVPIVHYIMFPLDNSDLLTAYNAKTDSQKRAAYQDWLDSIASYPTP